MADKQENTGKSNSREEDKESEEEGYKSAERNYKLERNK